jgi:hypothetical protein
MDDIDKLKHLIKHWAEHNAEHAQTYREWAKKAGASGKKELAGILMELAEGTMKLGKLFEKAEGIL